MTRAFKYGGFIAAAVLIMFGVVAIVMGVNGRSTVQDSLKLEAITGSADMTPAGIAGKAIDTGGSARCFASYMRIHALEASGGKTYSQLPRFATADGTGTSDKAAALKSDSGAPVSNPARDQWITATALTSALHSPGPTWPFALRP